MVFDKVSKTLVKVFGSRSDRLVSAYKKVAEQACEFEEKVKNLNDEALKAKTEEFKALLTTWRNRELITSSLIAHAGAIAETLTVPEVKDFLEKGRWEEAFEAFQRNPKCQAIPVSAEVLLEQAQATIDNYGSSLSGSVEYDQVKELILDHAGDIADHLRSRDIAASFVHYHREIATELRKSTLQDGDPIHTCKKILENLTDTTIDHMSPDKIEAMIVQYAKQLAHGLTDENAKAMIKPLVRDPNSILCEAFAVVREAARRKVKMRHFDIQLVGGKVLYDGKIAEMATGEGKTLVATLAAYLTYLAGKKVHIVTVNDYLAKRDAEWMGPVYEALGLTVGAIQAGMDTVGDIRKAQYACDITYGTNSEFGFDYLRDNMKMKLEDMVQPEQLQYAIVDEVDSILIDEARTPLIISGPAFDDVTRYKKADQVARKVISLQSHYDRLKKTVDAAQRTIANAQGELSDAKKGKDSKRMEQAQKVIEKSQTELETAEAQLAGTTQYYEVEQDRKAVHLTHEGVGAAQDIAGVGSFFTGSNMEWPHLLEQSLRAHITFESEKDYVVMDGNVIIVDEFTGRLMYGRQWSDGLHQAVEAKENVPIKKESQTLATITLQNFFKLYDQIAGMTGTAATESEEFMNIYDLEVVNLPTNRPRNRVDSDDVIYRTESEKLNALVQEINDTSAAGRPVLVGTTSVEKNEALSNALKQQYGKEYPHEVLNAKNHAREATIVAKAGQQHKGPTGRMRGNITIATNMAGRGTDIKLSPSVVYEKCKVPSTEELQHLGVEPEELFPPGITKCCIMCPQYEQDPSCSRCFKPKIDPDFPARGRNNCSNDVPCGLHIVGTERHEARRIDNQLRGRAGRQGDPGSSLFFLSFDDDLMRIFAPEWTVKALSWIGWEEGQPIYHSRISKGIEKAQKKVEERNFEARKSLLEYDEVMDYQRKIFYERRREILTGKNLKRIIEETLRSAITKQCNKILHSEYPTQCIIQWAREEFKKFEVDLTTAEVHYSTADIIEKRIKDKAKDNTSDSIVRTLREYLQDYSDPDSWDVDGLLKWAKNTFDVSLSPAEIKERFSFAVESNCQDGLENNTIPKELRQKFEESEIPLSKHMNVSVQEPGKRWRISDGFVQYSARVHNDELQISKVLRGEDIEEQLIKVAGEQIDGKDCSPLEEFKAEDFALNRLVEWVRATLDVELDVEQLSGFELGQVRKILLEKAVNKYQKREIEYPVDFYISLAYGPKKRKSKSDDKSMLEDKPLLGGLEVLVEKVNQKYNAHWYVDKLEKLERDRVRSKLLELSESFYHEKLEEEVDKQIEKLSPGQLAEWARKRFDAKLWEYQLNQSDNIKDVLMEKGREFLRSELTDMERNALGFIYDETWKAHLYAMDHLKSNVWMRSWAEKDPKTEYKREGSRMFNETLETIEGRVADLILKMRLEDRVDVRNIWNVSQTVHDEVSQFAIEEHKRAELQRAAALKPQEAPKVEQIKLEIPKVGRNEPCPCGSGKKYKKCCGKNA